MRPWGFRSLFTTVKFQYNLTKEFEGAPPLLNRVLLALLRPSAKFPIAANDVFVKLQCNSANEFAGWAPY